MSKIRSEARQYLLHQKRTLVMWGARSKCVEAVPSLRAGASLRGGKPAETADIWLTLDEKERKKKDRKKERRKERKKGRKEGRNEGRRRRSLFSDWSVTEKRITSEVGQRRLLGVRGRIARAYDADGRAVVPGERGFARRRQRLARGIRND